jgi:6-phosphofructokinase 1
MNIQTYGVKWGYRGLFEDQFDALTSRDVSGKIGRAGCFLGTANPAGCLEKDQIQAILANLNKRSIDGVIVIGDRQALQLSPRLISAGVPVIGIPSTIQDDISGTDICLGVDSAVNNIMKSVDNIRSCDSSRNRLFLVQVEGRECGQLALRSAMVTGAEFCLIPENPQSDLAKIADAMMKSNLTGKTQCITIISSGWKPGIAPLAEYLEQHEKDTDLAVRQTVLGYVQRGGNPSGFDRILGTRFGAEAVAAIADGISGHIVALHNEKIERIPFNQSIDKIKVIDPSLVEIQKITNI